MVNPVVPRSSQIRKLRSFAPFRYERGMSCVGRPRLYVNESWLLLPMRTSVLVSAWPSFLDDERASL